MTQKETYVFTADTSGVRVDKFISENLKTKWSRSHIQKAIEHGSLSINDIVVTETNYRAQIGDICKICLEAPSEISLQPSKLFVDILFEDEDLLVVNKPEGQVVHLGNGVAPGTTLVEALLSHCNLSAAAGALRPGVVHRLDQATSGVILFAKTDAAYWNLTRMFAERQIHKTYHALVRGIPKLLSGNIDAPIGRNTRDRTAMCITHQGRNAYTHWKCLEKFETHNQSLLQCSPITGRTHQIRVHLKSIEHPIVGDPKYGHIEDKRLFLHAYKIEFLHPITNAPCTFIAPWPPSFRERIEFLRNG